jgi:small-conductance mechanosensitive channel
VPSRSFPSSILGIQGGVTGSHLVEAVLALVAAGVIHAGLRRLERRLPLWIAGHSPSAVARLRGPIGLAMLLPKAALWLGALAFVADRVMTLGTARDVATAAVRMSLTTPLLVAEGRSFTALELLELPALLAAVWIGVGLLARLLRWQLARASGMEGGPGDALATLARYVLGALGALVVLQAWGFDVRSFALLGGVIGVGLGFGLQNITSNFVSGLLIAFERPIKPGDFVRVGEFSGTVRSIGARSTEIRTTDHVSILVPNSRFLEGEVVNWSHGSPVCRLHVPVGVAYGSDPARVRTALLGAIHGHPKILAEPRPEVDLDGFGESALLFDLEVWTSDPATQNEIVSDLNYQIAASLRRHGIEIPFPQHDLHLRSPELLRLAEAFGRREFPDWNVAPPPATPSDAPEPAAESLSGRPAAWGEEELRALAERLRGRDGVEIADRRHLLAVHRRCFVGSDAVRWLVAREGLARAEALEVGRRLVEIGLVRHVLDEHDFEDAHLFYRFRADEEILAGAG